MFNLTGLELALLFALALILLVGGGFIFFAHKAKRDAAVTAASIRAHGFLNSKKLYQAKNIASATIVVDNMVTFKVQIDGKFFSVKVVPDEEVTMEPWQ